MYGILSRKVARNRLSLKNHFCKKMGLCELCLDSYSKHMENVRTKQKAQSQQQ